MQIRKTMLPAVAAVAFALAGTAAIATQGAMAQSGAKETAGRMELAMRGHGKHHGMNRLCSPRRAQRIERMIAFAESFMDLTPPQQQAFDDLTLAVRDANSRMDQLCDEHRKADDAAKLSARLARFEAFLSAGLKSVQEVRPHFDKFYTTLDAKQQKALDDMFKHREHRGRHFRR
jgi:hypothetical protein